MNETVPLLALYAESAPCDTVDWLSDWKNSIVQTNHEARYNLKWFLTRHLKRRNETLFPWRSMIISETITLPTLTKPYLVRIEMLENQSRLISGNKICWFLWPRIWQILHKTVCWCINNVHVQLDLANIMHWATD